MFFVILKILFPLFILNSAEGFGPRRDNSRIIGGDVVQINDFPYYAGLWNCGGAILSDRWVVTAAHCVLHNRSSEYVWVGGESFEISKVVKSDGVVIAPDPEFPESQPRNDIALIHLSEPLEFTDEIQPIDLPSGIPSSKSVLTLVGRGIDETGKLSRVLKKMDVHRLATQQCLNHIENDTRKMIMTYQSEWEKIFLCAARADGQPGMCMGDSGSPLARGNTLIGLASFIRGEKDLPDMLQCVRARLGFYVNVTSFVPWIKSVTGLK